MKRRRITAIGVLAIIVAATYLATSQPIGPVGIRYVQTDSSLTGSGVTANTLKVNTANVQARVTGTCTSPNAIRVVNSDGTVTCTTGVVDTAGSGLNKSGSTLYVGAGSGILAAGTVTSTNIGAGLTYSSGAIVPNLSGASCGAGSAMTALSSAGAGTCTGLISGTSGRSTRFSSTTAIGNGGWTDDGTNVTSIGTVSTVSTTTLGDDKGDVLTFSNGPTGINRYAGIHKEWIEEFTQSSDFAIDQNFGSIGMGYWAAGTGSPAFEMITTVTGRFGIWALDTNVGTVGSVARINTGFITNLGATTSVNGYLTFQFDALSSSSQSSASEYVARWGLTDTGFSDSSGDVTNGCFLMYDKGNTATGNKNPTNLDRWECGCAAGGTRTIYLMNSSGNSDESFALGDGTVAAATFYRWHIKITTTAGTPTRAEFYKVAQDDVETKVCDINTNLPTATTVLRWDITMLPKASTGTGSRQWQLDQFMHNFDASASRNP